VREDAQCSLDEWWSLRAVSTSTPPTDPPETPVIPLRSKERSPQRADRTPREQELLDLLATIKRQNRRTADALFLVMESIAKTQGNTLVQALCRVVDFANKNRRAR
jgi:hypothetical protein